FFLPVRIPTILHILWVQHNCPIPPGLEKEVCKIICDKISASVYKPLNSAYCLRWFCVLKKNGKLRIVHSLELLNCVTICHSGVPLFLDHVAESFTRCISLWEFFELLNRVLQQMKYCSGTFSGHKLVLCTLTFKILVVDTLYIAVGYYLCQCTSNNHKECCYNCFGLIMLNNREARFSQPKLELYSLYQALQALQMYLIGVRNLIIEVNTCYIKGMLQNPDIQPSTSMNHWIMAILMFHFELVHIKGTLHGPNTNNSDNSIYEDWINRLHGFIHQVQLLLPLLHQVSMASHHLPPLAKYDYLHPLVTFTNDGTTTYSDIPCSAKAIASNTCVLLVKKWLHNIVRPKGLSDKDYATFIHYASMFFTTEEVLSDQVVRILGQNPGKFTLQGTNTYIIGKTNPYTLIDTAEGREEYIPILESALKETVKSPNPTQPDVSDIIIFHWHPDHIGGLPAVLILLQRFKLSPELYTPSLYGEVFHDLYDSQILLPSGLRVLHTPGHTTDSVALYVPQDRVLYTADTVLGHGTSVFEDLSTYLTSLTKMLNFNEGDGYTSLYPGHGPVVPKGKELIDGYIRHRLEREAQILNVLRNPPPTVLDAPVATANWTTWTIVTTLYAAYPESLWLPAARGVDLHLKKLEKDGIVRRVTGELQHTSWELADMLPSTSPVDRNSLL
ncbi:Beta-lactamase-like protein 2 like protein, partial [Termitomyces sp. J132]